MAILLDLSSDVLLFSVIDEQSPSEDEQEALDALHANGNDDNWDNVNVLFFLLLLC